MSQPITWQNINAPNNMDASQQMTAATNSFNNAFSGLQGALQQNDQIEAKKFDKQKILNTQSYLNQVDELGKTPEQLQAAIQSGALDKLRQSFGPNIDHAAVRGAGETLLNQRYQQAKAATEYSHMAADERTAGIADQYKALMTKGDPESVAQAGELFNQYRALGGRSEASLVAFGDERGQIVKKRGYEDVNQGINVKAAEDALLTSANTRKNQTMNAESSRISANSAAQGVAQQGKLINEQIIGLRDGREQVRKTYEAQLSAAQAAGLKARLGEEGNLYAEGVYTGKQAGELAKLLVENKVGGEGGDAPERRANLLARFASGTIDITGPDGKKIDVPIPYSAMKAVALSAINPLVARGWNKGTAADAEEKLRAIMQATYKGADGRDRNVSQDQFVEYQNATQRVSQNPALNPKLKVPAGAQVPPAPLSMTEDFKKKVMRLTESSRQ